MTLHLFVDVNREVMDEFCKAIGRGIGDYQDDTGERVSSVEMPMGNGWVRAHIYKETRGFFFGKRKEKKVASIAYNPDKGGIRIRASRKFKPYGNRIRSYFGDEKRKIVEIKVLHH